MPSLAELRSIVGDAHAVEREGGDGAEPRFTATPGSVDELSALMALASRAGWRVSPRGGGSKERLGSPPHPLDLAVSTARLTRLLEHAAGDLVTRVEAGIRLDTLQGDLAGAGQMLALDPPEAGATVGGVVATNASGPRRLRYGTVRDLLIGITVVLADGTVARAGGKVVKNVAGYDLGKLFAGSLGTLGVIAGATFRLHPRPPSAGALLLTVDTPAGVEAAVTRVLSSTLVPAAVELDGTPGDPYRVVVLFEGIAPGVESQLSAAAALLGSLGTVRLLSGDELDAHWSPLLPRPWVADGVGLKITHLPARVGSVLAAVSELSARHGARGAVRGSPASGVLYVGLPPLHPASAGALLAELRGAVGEGSVVVQDAPAEHRSAVDVWGPVRGLELMRRVKREFDPAGVLNPGRFVGGI